MPASRCHCGEPRTRFGSSADGAIGPSCTTCAGCPSQGRSPQEIEPAARLLEKGRGRDLAWHEATADRRRYADRHGRSIRNQLARSRPAARTHAGMLVQAGPLPVLRFCLLGPQRRTASVGSNIHHPYPLGGKRTPDRSMWNAATYTIRGSRARARFVRRSRRPRKRARYSFPLVQSKEHSDPYSRPAERFQHSTEV